MQPENPLVRAVRSYIITDYVAVDGTQVYAYYDFKSLNSIWHQRSHREELSRVFWLEAVESERCVTGGAMCDRLCVT